MLDATVGATQRATHSVNATLAAPKIAANKSVLLRPFATLRAAYLDAHKTARLGQRVTLNTVLAVVAKQPVKRVPIALSTPARVAAVRSIAPLVRIVLARAVDVRARAPAPVTRPKKINKVDTATNCGGEIRESARQTALSHGPASP